MVLAGNFHFPRCRTSGCSTPAAVETHTVDRGAVVDDRRVVSVVHDGYVYVGYSAIVVVRAASPVAAEEANAGVAEAVVNATVVADFRSPISGVPSINTVIPSPVPWSPEQTDFRRFYPGARNPEIAVRAISPVARDPDEARRRTDRLNIYWQNRRTKPNGDAYSNFRPESSGYRQ